MVRRQLLVQPRQFADVYKRQIVGFTFGGDLAAAGTPEKVTIISVSYTHLDVYKRQDIYSGLLFCLHTQAV